MFKFVTLMLVFGTVVAYADVPHSCYDRDRGVWIPCDGGGNGGGNGGGYTPHPQPEPQPQPQPDPAAEERRRFNQELQEAKDEAERLFQEIMSVSNERADVNRRYQDVEEQLERWKAKTDELDRLTNEIQKIQTDLGMPESLELTAIDAITAEMCELAKMAHQIRARMGDAADWRSRNLGLAVDALGVNAATVQVISDPAGLMRTVLAKRMAAQPLPQAAQPAPQAAQPAPHADVEAVPAEDSLDWAALHRYEQVNVRDAKQLRQNRAELAELRQKLADAEERLRNVDDATLDSQLADARSRDEAMKKLEVAAEGGAFWGDGPEDAFLSKMGGISRIARVASERIVVELGRKGYGDPEELGAKIRLALAPINQVLSKPVWDETRIPFGDAFTLKFPNGHDIFKWAASTWGEGRVDDALESMTQEIKTATGEKKHLLSPRWNEAWDIYKAAHFLKEEAEKLSENSVREAMDAARQLGEFGTVGEEQEIIDRIDSTQVRALHAARDVAEDASSVPLSWFMDDKTYQDYKKEHEQ